MHSFNLRNFKPNIKQFSCLHRIHSEDTLVFSVGAEFGVYFRVRAEIGIRRRYGLFNLLNIMSVP